MADGREGCIPVTSTVDLWYRVAGSGAAVVVVPTTGNDRDFDALVGPDRTVVFYDARNRGRSGPVAAADAGFEAEVADLEAVRRALRIESFAALGTSYQAGVLTAYALRHPHRVSRLVLASAIPLRSGVRPAPARQPAPHQVAHLDQLEAAGLRELDPAALCRAWREVYVPLLMGRPETFERLTPVCSFPCEHPWNAARALVHVFADLHDSDWRPQLRALRAPTMIVRGSLDHDPLDAAIEWVDAVADGRLLDLDGIGQLPWVEAPAEFFGPVNRFLAGERV